MHATYKQPLLFDVHEVFALSNSLCCKSLCVCVFLCHRLAKTLAIYGIEKPRNSENLEQNRQKVEKSVLYCLMLFFLAPIVRLLFSSEVVPANQTPKKALFANFWEEARNWFADPNFKGFYTVSPSIYHLQEDSRTSLQTPSMNVGKPHFLWFSLLELLLISNLLTFWPFSLS